MAKQTNSIPEFIEERAATPDKLKALRQAVSELRDLELLKNDLKDQLTQTNITINRHTRETLPDLFQDAGLTSITLEGTGNVPPYVVKLETEITANIAAGWSPDEKEKAFDWLAANGAEDLIKATVTITFARNEIKKAEEVRDELEEQGLEVELDMKVHHQVLSSWLRERFMNKKVPKGIATIGGYIGPIVKLTTKR